MPPRSLPCSEAFNEVGPFLFCEPGPIWPVVVGSNENARSSLRGLAVPYQRRASCKAMRANIDRNASLG